MSASSAERASARPLSSSACSSCTASPKGLAIGTAYASDRAGLSLFVILAIGLQNIPEGTSVAIPMAAAGFSRAEQFWAAVLTSAPQPVGAVLAFLVVEQVQGLLPASFAFAAGAMLALVAFELVPQAFGRGPLVARRRGERSRERRRCFSWPRWQASSWLSPEERRIVESPHELRGEPPMAAKRAPSRLCA